MWNILPRFSVYLIVVLSVSRAITLWNPFRPAKKQAILISIVGYLLILILQSCLPYMYSIIYKYDDFLNLCSWRFDDPKFDFNHTVLTILNILLVYIEFCAPALPILISVALTVWCLLNGRAHSGGGVIDNEKRDATITVIILTVIYILCNLFLWVYYTADLFYYFGRWDYAKALDLRDFHLKLVSNVYFHHSVALNSLFNAIVYFVRRKKLQKFVCHLFRKYICDLFKMTNFSNVRKLADFESISRWSYMSLGTTISVVLRTSTPTNSPVRVIANSSPGTVTVAV